MFTRLIFLALTVFSQSNSQSSGYTYRQPQSRFASPGFTRDHFNGIKENRHQNNFQHDATFHDAINEDVFIHENGRFYSEDHESEPVRKIIQKHVYVHVPPPEPEEEHPQCPIFVPPPEKHYKIIFIKAPTAPTPTAPIIPVQPQNEEKTLVYLLVRKPEQAPEIILPTAASTEPSKPEVYFIRYKAQTGYQDVSRNENKGETLDVSEDRPLIDTSIDGSRSEQSQINNGIIASGYNYDVPK